MNSRTFLVSAALCLSALAAVAISSSARADDIKLRISASHGPASTYVRLLQEFFVPEVKKRVAERTRHRVDFIEGYGGSMLKIADSLEGVQAGVVDLAGYCFCFEPSNLALHNFQAMLPFNVTTAEHSLAQARAVYAKVPFLGQQLENKFGQKLLALLADPSYQLGTAFEWSSVADLKGKKIAAAGPNAWWLEYTGATPVQSSLVEAYTSLQTGVYGGWIMFTPGWANNKLYEVAKHFTVTGFGAPTWHGLVVNTNRFKRLPKEVQDILVEVGREYEILTARTNDELDNRLRQAIKNNSLSFRELSAEVRLDWARHLKDGPRKRAEELEKRGMPALKVLQIAMEEAEKLGHVFPVRYDLDNRR